MRLFIQDVFKCSKYKLFLVPRQNFVLAIATYDPVVNQSL